MPILNVELFCHRPWDICLLDRTLEIPAVTCALVGWVSDSSTWTSYMCFLHHICLSLELLCHCKTSFSRTELSFLNQRCLYLDDSYKCFLLQSYLLPDKPWVARGFRRWKEETRLWWVIQNMTMGLPEIYLVEPTTLVSHPGRAFHMIMFSIIWTWGYPKYILLNPLYLHYHRYQHKQWIDHGHLTQQGVCESVAVSLFVDKSE